MHQMASPEAQSFGRFGESVALTGDVDNDGLPDLVVGAPSEGSDALPGRAHLFRGADGTNLQTFASPDPEKRSDFGLAVAGLGDVDEDGSADAAVGAPRESTGRRTPQAGRVYYFSGRTGEELETIESPNESPNGRFGFSLDQIGDVDGDGWNDLIVGAPSEVVSEEPATQGRVYLLSGVDGDDMVEIEPPSEGTRLFGYAVSGIGDVNDNGSRELLVGAIGASPQGTHWAGGVRIFDGDTRNLLISIDSPNPVADGHFGASVAVVGDTNGDGVDDFMVGAPGESTSAGSKSGRAYLFSGSNGQLLHSFTSPSPQSSGRFGTSVSGGADVNGDGAADVFVGAPGEASSAGRLHVFSGADGSSLFTLRSPQDVLNGSFGSAISPAGDLNGDGVVDVLVGATGENDPSGTEQTGRAYVFSGNDLSAPPAAKK